MKAARTSASRSQRREGGGGHTRALLLVAVALVAGVAGLVGWLASQPPLPESFPYFVALPEAPAVSALPAPPGDDEDTEQPRSPSDVSVAALDVPRDEGERPREAGAAGDAVSDEDAAAMAVEARRAALGARATTVQPSPHPAFIEQGPYGLLPVIAADGRESWQIYARPYDDSDPRPLVAVVLSGLGMNRAWTSKALRLPGEVTLAFSPYAANVEEWARQARAAGHELLLEVPMEPARYPADDPGPRALLTSLGPNQNLDRLAWTLARFAGYVGVIEGMGGRFTTSAPHLKPILGEFKRRGLLYVDRHSVTNALPRTIAEEMGLLRVGANIDIDAEPSRREISKRLAAALALARHDGTAVVVARPLPVTFELLDGWFDRLEAEGIALAPITAVTARQATG
jgi:polysaccharide deacetylase 2 family uncharacterized protein YibQ